MARTSLKSLPLSPPPCISASTLRYSSSQSFRGPHVGHMPEKGFGHLIVCPSLLKPSLLPVLSLLLPLLLLLPGNWYRHTGHELWSLSHGVMQSEWYTCLHGISFASSPCSKSSLQTGHWDPSDRWASVISTVGIELIAEVGAGGGPGLSFWVKLSIRLFRFGPTK